MTYEKIKELLEKKKIEKARAEVRLQQIEDTWMKEFGTKDPEEVKKHIEDMKADLEQARTTYSNLLEKAENELLAMEAK